jgi:WD40 repeat protein
MSIDWQARKQTISTIIETAIILAGMALTACTDRQQPPPVSTSYAGPRPPHAVARLGRGVINWLVPSPDGTAVAAAGDVGLVLYNTETLEEIWSLPSTSSMTTAGFSGDGDILAVGLSEGRLLLVDAISGEELVSQPIPLNTEIVAVALSPTQSEERWSLALGLGDGSILLTTVNQTDADEVTLASIVPLTRLSGTVTALAFSPNSATFAAGDLTGTISLWDTGSGEFLGTLNGHEPRHAITDLTWVDDETLISGGKDGRIVVWDAAAGEATRTQDTRQGPVLRTSAWAQGTYFGAARADGIITIWKSGEALPLTDMGDEGGLRAAAWSPTGDWLMAAADDGRLLRWPVRDGQIDEPDQTLVGHSASGEWAGAVAWSPEGDRLATGLGSRVFVWDAATTRLLRTLTGHTGLVNALAWSPDGSRLASASRDETAIIWNAATGERVATLEGHTDAVFSVAWAPDGERVATAGSLDDSVIIWDAATGERLRTLTSGREGVWSVAWQPGTDVLAVGTTWGNVDLWDTADNVTDAPYESLAGPLNWVSDLAWSPNGEWLAAGSGDTRVTVWDVEVASQEGRLAGHTAPVLGVSFSPDGERLASGGDDGQLLIWSFGEEGSPSDALVGHTDGINAVDWAPDGERLASASDDGTVIIWDVPAQ